ncbi:MAG TPA: hypothetical protein VIU14_00220 [Mesorhizobium sp.]
MDDIAHIAAALEPSGLTVRGAINFSPEEGAPPGPDGGPARCVLLIGNVGGTFWPIFQKWRAEGRASIRNPLDNWSAEVIANIAKVFGARAVSPSDRPFLPFQQWAMRAEGLRPSPLGILMHPRYGLWHAYRGALLFSRPLDAPEKAPTVPHPCDSCVAKPCLHACPASAHSLTGFDYSCCVGHVRSANGTACREVGCLDRNACPYGAQFRYPADLQAFLMAAYARL